MTYGRDAKFTQVKQCRAHDFFRAPRLGGSRLLGYLQGPALAALMACAPKTGAPPDGPNSGKDSAAATTDGTLSWRRGDWPAELRADPDWQSAARGESWALLRLSERRTQLRHQLQAGGPAVEVALRAWPLTRVAWAERGVLCRALPSYVAADWAPLLLALSESAGSEDSFGEVLDPDAVFVCERTFELLDGRASAMTPAVFDQYAATCQAFGRTCPLSTPR